MSAVSSRSLKASRKRTRNDFVNVLIVWQRVFQPIIKCHRGFSTQPGRALSRADCSTTCSRVSAGNLSILRYRSRAMLKRVELFICNLEREPERTFDRDLVKTKVGIIKNLADDEFLHRAVNV